MRNQRRRSAQNKGGRRGSNSNDFISQMPDDVLVMILCLLPIKDAVVTSSLSTRWRFMWCKLNQLNFDGSEKSAMMATNWDAERFKFINQVNCVIQSYNHPKVEDFRVHFDLNKRDKGVIDDWLQFAVSKNVEMLELNLMDTLKFLDIVQSYAFPSRLSDGNRTHILKWLSLKKLILKNVDVWDANLQEFLRNSPNVETVCIHGAEYLVHVCVGGQALKLKHFEITNCRMVEFIHLFDFDLESFSYKGQAMDLQLTSLPKLKEVNIGQGLAALENNVFSQISSCCSHLQYLSLNIYRPKKSFKVDSIPKLSCVKKLRLTLGARKDDSLIEFASIANACPILETFTTELLWSSPMKRRRKARAVASDHHHEHLKLLQILGYYGRISDFELAAYIMQNAVALNKIVIDTRWQGGRKVRSIKRDFSKNEKAVQSSAEHQLVPILPQGTELVIL